MPGPTSNRVTCRIRRGAAVVTARGQVTAALAGDVMAAVRRVRRPQAVLDLRGAPAPRAGEDPLRPLLELRRRLRQARVRLVLCGLPPALAELFRATWLLGLFEVQPDVAAALASLAG
jgi:anti-anti-sigma regulatory factor